MRIGRKSRDMPINREFHDEIMRVERAGFDIDLKVSCGNSFGAEKETGPP